MRHRRKSSFTAEAAAAARARGAMEPDPKLRCGDDLALHPWFRKSFIAQYERRGPGVFFHHVARTKHIDALLSAEIDAGMEQVVLLGAGYDTRAYRFAARLDGKRVFEVDHPATSAMKQRRVARVLGAPPVHVTYVPVNFLGRRHAVPRRGRRAGNARHGVARGEALRARLRPHHEARARAPGRELRETARPRCKVRRAVSLRHRSRGRRGAGGTSRASRRGEPVGERPRREVPRGSDGKAWGSVCPALAIATCQVG
jgi:hypothetical protein